MLRVVRTAGIAEAVAAVAPGLVVEEVDVAGPPTSAALRAAGLGRGRGAAAVARGAAARCAAPERGVGRRRRSPTTAASRVRGARAADPLDEVVLRSYCIGAAHMALGWVASEGLAVDADGEPLDLTIR